MTTSYFSIPVSVLCSLLVVIKGFNAFGQSLIPASVSMEAASPCSGSINMITFRANGVCPSVYVQWNIPGQNFVFHSSGGNWIKGYFTAGGDKTIGCYYRGVYTSGACDFKENYIYGVYKIGESSPIAGIISGDLQRCSGETGGLAVSNFRGEILGWEKKLPEQTWSSAAFISVYSSSLPSQYIDDETKNYRVKIGSNCVSPVYAYATVNVIRANQPTASNLTGYCGTIPEVLVHSQADPGGTVYHNWYAADQLVPFTEILSTFVDYGNDIYESSNKPSTFAVYDLSAKVNGCVSKKTRINVTYQNPTPPPSGFNFFINTINSPGKSIKSCTGENIDVTVSANMVSGFKWYYPDNLNFDNDNRAIISAAKMSPGANSIKVTGTFKNECGASTTITDYFTVYFTSPSLTIINPDADAKYCNNETVKIGSAAYPLNPQNTSYSWILNSEPIGISASFESVLNPGNYSIQCVLKADFTGCLFPKNLSSNKLSFKVLTRPGLPTAGNVTQECPGQPVSFTVSSSLNAGYVVKHAWYNSTDLFITEKETSNPTSTVYFSTYYPDAFPESSRTFKVSAKVIDGSFACESGKTSVTYTKSFPGPPPSSLNFFVFSVNSATHSVNACNGEFIDVMVSGTNLKDFKWYYPAGSVFDTDYRAVIKTDLLNPGKNSIKVTSNYTDECGAVYGITDYFIVNITVPELVISGMNPSGKYCKNESISLKCQTIPAGPTNAIYNWYINNTWASSAMDYSSLLNVGSYEVFSRVTAKFYGCLFSKTIQSKTTPFKVMPVPDPPYATDTYQNCPDQITPIIATTNFEAGRMINHILYNSMDQIVTERTASNISTNVYSSSFYPDPFPESSRIFKVAAKLVDGTYGCESAKREVNYIKDFPPPPPGNLLFIFNDEITPKDNIHICRNDKLRIEALEIPQVSDYTWYGQDGREIEQEPDYSILLTGDDLFPGVNNIIVNAVYDDGCIPGGIPVTDQIIIDLHSISPPVISGVKHSCDTTIVIKSEPGNASWYWQTDPQNPEFVNNNPEFMLTDNGNVILMAFDGYCWSEPVIQEISVVKSPVLQVTGSTELCQGSSVSLNAEAPGAITYIWYSAEHKQVLHYGSKYNSPELQGNTAFSVASFNEKGCRSELTLNIRIYPPNEVLPSIPFLTKPGNDYILHLNNDPTPDFNFYWVTGPEGTHGLVQDEVSPANPGEAYFVRSLDKNGCWGPAVSVIVPDILLEEYQQPLVPEILNYTKALNFKKESTSPDPDNPYEINMITEYTDGLGRTIQKVSRQASPLRMDIVEMIKYDAISNEVIRTLPFVCGTSDGDLKASPVKEMIRFYHSSDKIPRNDFPFTLTLSETSPLRRKLEIGHPGEPWVFAIGSANAKTERFSWQVNSNDDQVIRWVPAQGRLIHEGFYTEGSLLKNITTDENGYRTIEFMNKQQRLILKRTQADPDGQEWAEIYYIYDNSGNLLFAVQPEVIRQVKESGSGFIMISGDPGNNTLINNMVFEYKYDERNRMIAKKIPGSGWIRMVYDRWDRIVFTQDGNQSKRNEWSYTKYDQLNRPIITGILNSVATAAELAIQLNEGDYGRSEERNNESIYGYTLNFSYPPLAGLDVLTVTFYDDYSFPHADEETFRFIPELKNEIRNENVTDMITGTMIIIPGTEKYLKSVIYYDDRYRIIQTISTNNEGGFDRESSMIEKLTGRVLETRTTHINPRSVNPVNTISKILDYDHMDRLTSIMHGIATSVTWEQSKNIQVEGNLITRKSGKGSSISGAISEKKIGANSDGWIEFTADQTTNTRVIGLTDNIISLSANTINYAFILDNGNARISESGLLSDSVIPFKVGDKFRIERINNKILFSINNRYIMQSENPGSPELFVKIYLLNEGATAYDVRISTTGGVFMAGNEYNELGMLIEKNIHELDSGKFLQSVDYRYNIRGWLTNINNSA
ncbi:MAG TPA: DUF6443 domain-containing protein, partial [Cyclobacteriaceae bacterium]|nr:DUF6443 domain-containing protein [Cyclobacteriaceae bacterium]